MRGPEGQEGEVLRRNVPLARVERHARLPLRRRDPQGVDLLRPLRRGGGGMSALDELARIVMGEALMAADALRCDEIIFTPQDVPPPPGWDQEAWAVALERAAVWFCERAEEKRKELQARGCMVLGRNITITRDGLTVTLRRSGPLL